MNINRPSYTNVVEAAAKAVCLNCKVCVEKMWEPERQALSPAYLVIFIGNDGEKNADAFIIDSQEKGWKVDRRSHNRVFVDPTPEYKVSR